MVMEMAFYITGPLYILWKHSVFGNNNGCTPFGKKTVYRCCIFMQNILDLIKLIKSTSVVHYNSIIFSY